MFNSYSENMGGAEVKKLTKVSILLLAFYIVTTVYAFAAFVVKQIDPLPDPVNLLILGISMTSTGYYLKHRIGK
jgi:uncharacterized membrane-anchored protein